MNIHFRACVQSVHHQQAHMISRQSCHWSIAASKVSCPHQTEFASSAFADRRYHELLFHTQIAV